MAEPGRFLRGISRNEVDMMTGMTGGVSPRGKVGALAFIAAAAMAVPLALSLAPSHASAQATDGGEIANFYRARGGGPLWFGPTSRGAAQQLLQLLNTAYADNLNPRRYNVKALARAVADAQSGNPAAIQRAEVMLSSTFVAYSRHQKRYP